MMFQLFKHICFSRILLESSQLHDVVYFFYGMFSDEAFCQEALSLIHIRDLCRASL